jgi:ATP-dependent Clp protease protease subunit
MTRDPTPDTPTEIGVVGDLTDHAAELTDKLLGIPAGGQCTLYFDSPGGSPYCALSLMTIMVLRDLNATGIVTGECSSAALWPLAACRRRLVTPFSVLLFHPMRWQSEEHVQLPEASEWARHFANLELQMDRLLASMLGLSRAALGRWMRPGRYVSGTEFAGAGLAELANLAALSRKQHRNDLPRRGSRRSSTRGARRRRSIR